MKSIFLSSILLCTLLSVRAQLFKNPFYKSKSEKSLYLREILLTDSNTLLRMEFESEYDGGIYLFINPPKTEGCFHIKCGNKNYYLRNAYNIGFTDGELKVLPKQKVEFFLEFEQIPLNKALDFDLIEGDGGSWSWHFYGINLTSITSYEECQEIERTNAMHSCWEEPILLDYFQRGSPNWIEGIYELYTAQSLERLRIGIKRIGEKYIATYLDGAAYKNKKKSQGDILAILSPTANIQLFKAIWQINDDNFGWTDEFYINFNESEMSLIHPTYGAATFIKLLPMKNSETNQSASKIISEGTAFALNSEGYLVTNFHVIDGANQIQIRGVGGNFEKAYKAVVVISDKKNDLALLKIDDQKFEMLDKIPYLISEKQEEVGGTVFVVGFPMRKLMGNEVKLTNGIISARSGYEGDFSSYQFSAPIQPGNSGGPLFNKKGEVIGIVNSKHTGAEGVGYAIKSTVLNTMLMSLDPPVRLNNYSNLTNKPLTDQFKSVKNFVYLVQIVQ